MPGLGMDFFAGAALAAGFFAGAALYAGFLATGLLLGPEFATSDVLVLICLGPSGMTKTLVIESENGLILIEQVMESAPDYIRSYALLEVEKSLETQKQVLLESDHRAQKFMTAGIALVTFYAAAVVATQSIEVVGGYFGAVGGGISAFIGILLCGWASRPSQQAYLPGTEPSLFVPDAQKKLSKAAFEASLIKCGQIYIDRNDLIIKRNSRVALWGAVSVVTSPVIAVLSAFAAFAVSR